MTAALWGPALVAEAERLGCTECRVVIQKRGHPRLYFRKPDGVERFYVFSLTPSDSVRGLQNAIGSLRKVIGVQRPGKAASPHSRRVRVKCKARAVRIEKESPRPDPWAVLTELKDRMVSENG